MKFKKRMKFKTFDRYLDSLLRRDLLGDVRIDLPNYNKFFLSWNDNYIYYPIPILNLDCFYAIVYIDSYDGRVNNETARHILVYNSSFMQKHYIRNCNDTIKVERRKELKEDKKNEV